MSLCAPNVDRHLTSASSPANCHLQPGKALYTTIREFVENSLDVSDMPQDSRVLSLVAADRFFEWPGVASYTRQHADMYASSRCCRHPNLLGDYRM